MKKIFCTICTPTYNRAYILPRAYASLQNQKQHDFEWLVIDDGSSDNTSELVHSWAATADFPIRYIFQENRGKHVALNRAAELATGELFAILDSDDWFADDWMEKLILAWSNLAGGDDYSGLVGLCANADGTVIGDRFPRQPWDASYAEMENLDISGDKCHVFTTAQFRQFPFPEITAERFIAEGLIWRRMSRHKPFRHVNQIFMFKEYLQDGLSSAITERRLENPVGTVLYYRDMAQAPDLIFAKRLRGEINLFRFLLHKPGKGKELRRELVRSWHAPFSLAAALPLYLHDCYRHKKPRH